MRISGILAVIVCVSFGVSNAVAQGGSAAVKQERAIKSLKRDVAKLLRQQSAVGPQGPAGPRGVQGLPGVAGASATDVVPSGAIIYGIVRGDTFGFGISAYASLPMRAPVPLTDAVIVIKATVPLIDACGGLSCLSANEQANQGLCGGTSTDPLPASGALCIYPTQLSSDEPILSQSLQGVAIRTDNGSGSPFGFKIDSSSTNFGSNLFEGIFAYRAP